MKTSLLASALLCQLLKPHAAHEPSAADASELVRAWNLLAIDAVRAKAQSDAQAARAYALLNVALYDGVWGILARFSGARAMALVSSEGAPANGDVTAAAATAAHDVLAALFPDQRARYDEQLAADLAPLNGTGRIDAGQAWGVTVAARVLAARANDGSAPADSQAAGAGPGQFRASWSGTQFRNLVPFAIASPAPYVGSGPPALAGIDYAAAFAEVKVLGNAALADAEKLRVFQFWNLAAGTGQPSGAWLQIALELTGDAALSLPETTRLFALLSMAMADTVAPTYTTKHTFRAWRPTTAIREAGSDGNPLTDPDPAWSARAGSVGGTPESWSGHSSFSAAAGAVLQAFFCRDDLPFSFASDSAPGAQPRSYPSVSAAVSEAGRSRIFGGLHFEFSNQAGLAAGRAIAAEVLATKLLLTEAPTHFGACPL
jgi:hypothetical protein